MPYTIRKLPNKYRYKVYNSISGKVHAKNTTLKKAKRQVALLTKLSKEK